jgi:hypothetical protein
MAAPAAPKIASSSPLAGPMRGAAQVRENTVSVAQKINDFITSHRPAPVCNRCIAQGIGLSDYGAPPAPICVTLATTGDFAQQHGPCSLCHRPRKVIRRI